MKKTLVSALTTALVVGAASTTFAAANPFSDVPADHWAYDAVSQLAADGVIEGYGDTTFQGDKNITRYEMAQMVAKAMAKTDVSAADKAMIDQLAAEFADELNNLGVRVSNLEKHADMVKWTGEARYRYWSTREDQKDGSTDKTNQDQLQFRLYPTAEVNDHWTVKARLTANTDLSSDESGDVKLTYAYAKGNYKNFEVKLGKQELYSSADEGLVVDDFFSGARVLFGSKLKVALEAGRFKDLDLYKGAEHDSSSKTAKPSTNNQVDNESAANYQGIEVTDQIGKLRGGASYRHFNSENFKDAYAYKKSGSTDEANIWSIGGGYNFDGNWDLSGAYAENTEADAFEKAGNVQVSYKGADKVNAGTWGAYAAYRHLVNNVAFVPTYDTATAGMLNQGGSKGWEIGADYTPFKNVYTAVSYFDGKHLANDQDDQVLFGRVSFFF